MLTIRKEQMAVFAALEMKKFEDRVFAHLNKCFSKRCKVLGEPKVRETIQHGIKRAAAYRISAERDVCKYVDLMMVFGPDFEQSSEHSWASAILDDTTVKSPRRRMKRLFAAAKEHTKAQGA